MTQQPQNSTPPLTNEELTAQVNALKASNVYRSGTIFLLAVANLSTGLTILHMQTSSAQRRAPEVNAQERVNAERKEFGGNQNLFDRMFGNSPKGGGKSVILDSVGR